ncbi:hypothetical protein XENORESO_010851, partial [Xenotaenia resolanae]
CAPRPGYMHIHPGAVALSPSPGGDAGQHSGDDRGSRFGQVGMSVNMFYFLCVPTESTFVLVHVL